MATGSSRGVTVGKPYGPFAGEDVPQRAVWTNPSNSVAGAYGAAVNQNAEDYDKIMGNYDTLLRDSRSSRDSAKINFQPLAYTARPQYQQTGRLSEVANNLSDMSRTGGYSEGDLSTFRARGLSPIRAIYANALQNLKRQKVLQGGYSPNYGAIAAKMAREQSGIIGDKNIELNANIAERVAQGKQFGLSNLAPIAQRESELTHQANTENASQKQRVDEINQQIMLEIEKMNQASRESSMGRELAATQGMTNLYGTTPALTNTFGSQVLASNQQNLSAQQAEANIRQQRANTGLQVANTRGASIPSSGGWTLPSMSYGSRPRGG